MLEKVEEEIRELRSELATQDRARIREELGDVLFSLAQTARHLGIDAEGALRDAGAKFERRFRHMEAALAEAGPAAGASGRGRTRIALAASQARARLTAMPGRPADDIAARLAALRELLSCCLLRDRPRFRSTLDRSGATCRSA